MGFCLRKLGFPPLFFCIVILFQSINDQKLGGISTEKLAADLYPVVSSTTWIGLFDSFFSLSLKHTNRHTDTHRHTHIHRHTHTHIHTHTHTHTHTHIHIHTQTCPHNDKSVRVKERW